MNEGLYTILAIDGDLLEWIDDPGVQSLRYDGLNWDQVMEMCRLSFRENYTIAIWRQAKQGALDDG